MPAHVSRGPARRRRTACTSPRRASRCRWRRRPTRCCLTRPMLARPSAQPAAWSSPTAGARRCWQTHASAPCEAGRPPPSNLPPVSLPCRGHCSRTLHVARCQKRAGRPRIPAGAQACPRLRRRSGSAAAAVPARPTPNASVSLTGCASRPRRAKPSACMCQRNRTPQGCTGLPPTSKASPPQESPKRAWCGSCNSAGSCCSGAAVAPS
mmetsp:Transcript_32182/g.94039  ORF Transcript_32182/g.94039 Transcript_32182/m.94039 type:complete len:209 (-) Transcript_32182:148-774(-)